MSTDINEFVRASSQPLTDHEQAASPNRDGVLTMVLPKGGPTHQWLEREAVRRASAAVPAACASPQSAACMPSSRPASPRPPPSRPTAGRPTPAQRTSIISPMSSAPWPLTRCCRGSIASSPTSSDGRSASTTGSGASTWAPTLTSSCSASTAAASAPPLFTPCSASACAEQSE